LRETPTKTLKVNKEPNPFNLLKELAGRIGWEAPRDFDPTQLNLDHWEVGESFHIRVTGDGLRGYLIFEGKTEGQSFEHKNPFIVQGSKLYFPAGIAAGADEGLPPGHYTPIDALRYWVGP
jgi:hypothetical protein